LQQIIIREGFTMKDETIVLNKDELDKVLEGCTEEQKRNILNASKEIKKNDVLKRATKIIKGLTLEQKQRANLQVDFFERYGKKGLWSSLINKSATSEDLAANLMLEEMKLSDEVALKTEGRVQWLIHPKGACVMMADVERAKLESNEPINIDNFVKATTVDVAIIGQNKIRALNKSQTSKLTDFCDLCLANKNTTAYSNVINISTSPESLMRLIDEGSKAISVNFKVNKETLH